MKPPEVVYEMYIHLDVLIFDCGIQYVHLKWRMKNNRIACYNVCYEVQGYDWKRTLAGVNLYKVGLASTQVMPRARGRDSHMEWTGMLVRNFEFNP